MNAGLIEDNPHWSAPENLVNTEGFHGCPGGAYFGLTAVFRTFRG